MKTLIMNTILDRAREVFDIEIAGLAHVRDQLDGGFTALMEACQETLDGGGKLVITGIGKSGHIGQKIAATLASTGSTAVFMHPVEAMHGDLGILCRNDLLIPLSYSGETEELLLTLPAARRLGVRIAAITGDAKSRLAQWSDVVVPMPVPREACPFNLAPTTTTTALLALGDALAMVLLAERGFTRESYGRLHPGGAIGRSVTLQICDLMRVGDRLALVTPETSVKDTLLAMTRARTGSAIVADPEGRLLGIFTDGDFRRHVERDLAVLERPVGEVMTHNPTSLHAGDLAVEALKIIEQKHIDDIVVLDADGKIAGIVDVQDLPGLKLM
jgi:arabinose-5-phosphate isomerase